VVIKASSGRQIEALVANLAAADATTREAAAARLTVIGSRAVERLLGVVESGGAAPARTAALGVLEAIADPRALDVALDALDDRDPGVASAAAGTIRPFLRGALGVAAVDRLAGVAIDAARLTPVRIAAIRALATLEPSTLAPLWSALRDDPDPDVRRLVKRPTSAKDTSREPAAAVMRAAERELPDDPASLREALAQAGEAVALPLLHRIVERVREREGVESAAGRRAEWTRTRAAAHVALANRGSRLAVYDLRESLEAQKAGTPPLPVEFLAALSRVGDRSCLEPIAAAYARSRKPARGQGDWWREHLAGAFRAIVQRERITRRHAEVKKLLKRSPQALEELWGGVRGAGGSGKSGR
jgi:HEAT repeat protein